MLDDYTTTTTDATPEGEAAQTLCKCERCGALVPELRDVVTYEGEVAHWCADCADAHASTCCECGRLVSDDDSRDVETWHGSRCYCPQCADERGVEMCDACGDWHMPDNMTTVHTSCGDVRWCYDCRTRHATMCEHCEEWYDDESHVVSLLDVRDADGDEVPTYLCRSCAERDYVVCDECGDLVLEDDAVYDDRREAYVCPAHAHSGYLHGYGHTYASRYYCLSPSGEGPDVSRGLYLGVELETEDARQGDGGALAEDVMTCAGGRWERALECKTDGSLSSDGVEVVSQPGTPDWHLREGGVWDDVLDALTARGARSHDGGHCGLHVHICRKYLRSPHDDDWYGERAAYVLDRLLQGHAPEWRRFSRRSLSGMGYCKMGRVSDDGWSDSDYYADCRTFADKMSKFKRGSYDRYQAVNLNNNETIEIRLWRGTLRRRTLRATLEATAALAIVARALASYPDTVELLSWADLKQEMDYALELEGLPHDDLDAYLVERGL